MAVDAISSLAASIYDETLTTQTTATSDNSTLTQEDFYQLLAASLQYQDMSDPMSTSEMMDQLTTLSSMTTMSSLSDAITNMATVINNMSTVTLTTYSTGLLGQEVTIATVDDSGEITGEVTGVVTGVDLTGSQSVYVDGESYSLSQIMSVGKVTTEDTGTEETEAATEDTGTEETEAATEDVETEETETGGDATESA